MYHAPRHAEIITPVEQTVIEDKGITFITSHGEVPVVNEKVMEISNVIQLRAYASRPYWKRIVESVLMKKSRSSKEVSCRCSRIAP